MIQIDVENSKFLLSTHVNAFSITIQIIYNRSYKISILDKFFIMLTTKCMSNEIFGLLGTEDTVYNLYYYNVRSLFNLSEYAAALLASLKTSYTNSPAQLRRSVHESALDVPAPLCHSYSRQEKDSAVAEYLARKARFNTNH